MARIAAALAYIHIQQSLDFAHLRWFVVQMLGIVLQIFVLV